jgi:Helix-turn-helix domain
MSITSTGAPKPGRQLAYRVNDAALVSGLCRSSLYNLMRRGELEFVTVGRVRMITDAALRKLLKLEEPADA